MPNWKDSNYKLKAIKGVTTGTSEFTFQNQLVDGFITFANLESHIEIIVPMGSDKTAAELIELINGETDLEKVESMKTTLESLSDKYKEIGGHYNINEAIDSINNLIEELKEEIEKLEDK